MVSVTGYDKNGKMICFGRDKRDPIIAEARAKRFAIEYIKTHPECGKLDEWTFTLDAFDRQIFQPVRPRA